MSSLLAGLAQKSITPPIGASVAGYFEPHAAVEIINDLFAEILILRSETGGQAALIDCDVIGLSEETVRKIRRQISTKTSFQPHEILISATHTHTGPYTLDIFEGEADQDYLNFLEQEVLLGFEEALNNLQPASLRITRTKVEKISCNRRVVFADGTVHTHITEKDLDKIVGREGPVDQELILLEVAVRDSSPKIFLMNFPLHPTNVRGDRICADFPGYLAEALEKQLHEKVISLFANGPCGNIDSKTPELETVAYGPERARVIAEQIAGAALQALPHCLPLPSAPISAASELVEIPLRHLSEEEIGWAQAVVSRGEPEDLFLTRGTCRPSLDKERVYAKEILHLARMKKASPTATLEVQGIRIGDLVIIGVPVELFCEFGLRIKEEGRRLFREVMVVELANGFFGYVPTPQSFKAGGYETRTARSSQLAPEAGGRLCEAAERLFRRLSGDRG
ncbi:MAG: Neutral/alkaline non-lysosomal ceramidase [Candidatus Hinthialibacteria bacterium OLB16]|nr:MAG: Neutral/alkaline non-lysosomal ceramidase [Candidatus Hinthialibacteria bacterium OLB16]